MAQQPIPPPPQDNLSGDVMLLKERLDAVRERIGILEDNLLETKRGFMSDKKQILEDLSSLKINLNKLINEINRLSEKLSEFASKQQVMVLERYINLLNPMSFITRAEVNTLIEQKLNEKLAHEKANE